MNTTIWLAGATGLVGPPRDPAALADAFEALLSDAARAEAMGRAGRDWLLSNATFEVMLARYLDVYANGRA